MKPYIVDTNILVRLITFDVPTLAQQASQQLQPLADNSVELPLYVLAEVVYVLSYGPQYQYSRQDIADSLLTITTNFPQFELDRHLLQQVLAHFTTTKLDFVDCLLLATNHLHHQTVLTFDKSLLRKLKQPS